MSSIFTRIVRREIPSFGVREDDRFYAFLDIRPVRPGHTLVIPKQEIDGVFDLPEDLLAALLPFARPVAEAIKKVTGAERIGVAVAGFEVPHAHLHLIPLNTMAEFDWTQARPESSDNLARMAEAIRAALGERA